jgi:hypothetical protein
LHDDIVVQLPVIIQHGEPEDEEQLQVRNYAYILSSVARSRQAFTATRSILLVQLPTYRFMCKNLFHVIVNYTLNFFFHKDLLTDFHKMPIKRPFLNLMAFARTLKKFFMSIQFIKFAECKENDSGVGHLATLFCLLFY